jgi:hypothetical protein
MVILDGRPGETLVRDIYFESREPGWEEPELVTAPSDVKVTVKPFDAFTRVLNISALIPEADARPANSTIVLRPRGRDERIIIPIRYGAGR